MANVLNLQELPQSVQALAQRVMEGGNCISVLSVVGKPTTPADRQTLGQQVSSSAAQQLASSAGGEMASARGEGGSGNCISVLSVVNA